MRKIFWGIVLVALFWMLVATGCGGKGTPEPYIAPAELTAEERDILQFIDSADLFVWDFQAPQGARRLTFRMDYYRNGELQQSLLDATRYSFNLQEGSGRVGVSLATAPNRGYGTNLGQVDFFDHITRTSWTVSFQMEKDSGSASFFTGFDLLEPYRTNDLGVSRWSGESKRMAALDEDILLVAFGLAEGQSAKGMDTVELEENPDLLLKYEYAYLLAMCFTAE